MFVSRIITLPFISFLLVAFLCFAFCATIVADEPRWQGEFKGERIFVELPEKELSNSLDWPDKSVEPSIGIADAVSLAKKEVEKAGFAVDWEDYDFTVEFRRESFPLVKDGDEIVAVKKTLMIEKWVYWIKFIHRPLFPKGRMQRRTIPAIVLLNGTAIAPTLAKSRTDVVPNLE